MVARKVAQSEIYSAVGLEFGMVAAMVAMMVVWTVELWEFAKVEMKAH